MRETRSSGQSLRVCPCVRAALPPPSRLSFGSSGKAGQHRGIDGSGSTDIDAHTELRCLESCRPRKPFNRVLRKTRRLRKGQRLGLLLLPPDLNVVDNLPEKILTREEKAKVHELLDDGNDAIHSAQAKDAGAALFDTVDLLTTLMDRLRK
jgi:hypothetical protein